MKEITLLRNWTGSTYKEEPHWGVDDNLIIYVTEYCKSQNLAATCDTKCESK